MAFIGNTILNKSKQNDVSMIKALQVILLEQMRKPHRLEIFVKKGGLLDFVTKSIFSKYNVIWTINLKV